MSEYTRIIWDIRAIRYIVYAVLALGAFLAGEALAVSSGLPIFPGNVRTLLIEILFEVGAALISAAFAGWLIWRWMCLTEGQK